MPENTEVKNPAKPAPGSLAQFIKDKRIHFQLVDGNDPFWAEFSADGTTLHSARGAGKFKVNGLKIAVEDFEKVELVFAKPQITAGDTFAAKGSDTGTVLVFKVLKVEAILATEPSKPESGS